MKINLLGMIDLSNTKTLELSKDSLYEMKLLSQKESNHMINLTVRNDSLYEMKLLSQKESHDKIFQQLRMIQVHQ